MPEPSANKISSRGPMPMPGRDLTTREKIILMESSKLHGHIFPPWTSPKPSEFDPPEYKDAGELSLSSVQLEVFDEWRRPIDIAQASEDIYARTPTMLANKAIDLVQDVTTDCSVVASLCAASARFTTDRRDMVVCNIFPRGEGQQQPAISRNGKYVIRLYFNGCSRKVVVDDRLPISRTTRALHVVDRNNPGLLWPALVEKAYLKVRGGYDFPGSNSGTDLWVLTGWIPEQLFIQSDDIVPNALWKRMYAAFNYGDVLVTMGTGKLTQREEEGMGLAGEHDYAVIDMKQCEGQQFFLIKNPWSEGTIWKGHTFLKNSVTDIRDTLGSLALADKVSPKGDGNFPLAPGTFWMGLNDVFQSFESIYLNWNTSLFSFKEDIHFNWDLSTYSSPDGSLEANPQYMVCSKAGGTVWLLLSRHFTTSSHDLSEELKASSPQKSEPGFISLCSFNNGGERVIFSDGANIHSPYVDSPNTLLKLELPAAEPVTIAVSEQALPRSRNRFTLSAFSLASLGLCEAREKFCYSAKQDGAWTASTAGGNASGLSYHTNPQYSLCLDKTSDLCLLLESLTEDLPIHVKLIWARGKPIHSITSRDVVGDSGEYRKGFTLATILGVPAGVYTVVCSTFESGQLGSFALRVKSVSPCSLGKISVTSAGRFVTKARTAVFTPGNTRLLARILSQRLNRVSVTAWSCRDSSGSDQGICSPLKLSIDYGQGPSKQTLGTSGEDEYLDGRAGLHLPEVDIQPNSPQAEGLWLVIERVAFSGLQSDEQVTVELVSDGPIEVHGWGVGEDGKTHLH